MVMLGRRMFEYPLIAASRSRFVDRIYVSSDDDNLHRLSSEYGVRWMQRPAELATDTALVEDVVAHAINAIIEAEVRDPGIVVLLLANAATVSPHIIDEGVAALVADPTLDSAVTVSSYNEYSPVRAKRIDEHGLLVPFGDVDAIPGASCDRDTQAQTWFCDGGAWVLRTRCRALEGLLPFRWMGRRTYPLRQEGGLDIDYWPDVARTETWLRHEGFDETQVPWERQDNHPPTVGEVLRS
ncbi:hypothetical protein A6V29_07635 [Blastococcus sp. CCUG 61487]|nr:hypothetical protein A6V29_07635 [Blastococcus sp. CCUG 61487]